MDFQSTRTSDRHPNVNIAVEDLPDAAAEKNLRILLDLNAATANAKKLYNNDNERLAADLMSRPLNSRQAFSYFGLMLGTFPPAAIFIRALADSSFRPDQLWILGILLIINLVSAVVGFFSGKWIGSLMNGLETKSWTKMMLLTPLLGILWGIIAGGAGGFIFFVIGAVFGAIIGGIVGGAALPAFVILHRALKRGDLIEARHFLPIACGITLSICAFVIGL